jgi:adenylate kinase family enzyme
MSVKHCLFFIIGPPGSGKTTLGKALAQRAGSGIAHYSAGELLRKKAASLPNDVVLNTALSQGKLVSSQTIISFLMEVITQEKQPVIVIDGFPRSVANAAEFEKILSGYSTIVFAGVIYLTIPTELAYKRTVQAHRRSDDTTEVFDYRMKQHELTRVELLPWICQRTELFCIDAAQDFDLIVQEVLQFIQSVVSAHNSSDTEDNKNSKQV